MGLSTASGLLLANGSRNACVHRQGKPDGGRAAGSRRLPGLDSRPHGPAK
jgi:hypothetical protein